MTAEDFATVDDAVITTSLTLTDQKKFGRGYTD